MPPDGIIDLGLYIYWSDIKIFVKQSINIKDLVTRNSCMNYAISGAGLFEASWWQNSQYRLFDKGTVKCFF